MEPKKTLTSLCVYCGSRTGNHPAYVRDAVLLGRAMARRKIALVYGGAAGGLMGAVADAVLEGGGQVTGVYPKGLVGERDHRGLSTMIAADSLPERKHLLMKDADAFAALPGGWGTLDEISEALVMNQLRVIRKPCAFLNTEGFYDDMFSFMDRAQNDGLLSLKNRARALRADNPEALLDLLEAHL